MGEMRARDGRPLPGPQFDSVRVTGQPNEAMVAAAVATLRRARSKARHLHLASAELDGLSVVDLTAAEEALEPLPWWRR
jgi:hypothetical protein